MTIDDLKKQGGYKVVGYSPAFETAPAKPKQTALEKIGGGLDTVFGGKQIGESLVKAGTNAYNLATGGVSKFNAGLSQNTVDVPALIGDYVKAGTTVASAGIGGNVGAAATAKTGLLGGAARGFGVGAATGAVEGGVQGGANALKNHENVLQGVGEGAATGAVLGGATGGIAGGASGALKSHNSATAKFAEDFVAPRETAKVKAQAIEQGRLSAPGLFKQASIEPSVKDTRVADAVRDVISPRNSLAKNVDAIRHKISTTNNGVKNYIEENKVPVDLNNLRTKLSAAKEDNQIVFASDATAEKTYNAVIDAFMKNVQQKDTAGLFEARQNFDKIPGIKKLLDSEALGENVKKTIVLDVRRAANEYIADQLPEGNMYRELLRQESHMIEGLGNAAEKGASTIGKNGIQLLTERYPILKWLVTGGAAGIGVGGAIIGSSN